MTDLGGLGYGVSLGFGINATGEAVGRSYLAQTVPTAGCPPRHTCVAHPADPFSWIAGSMTDLGTLGGTNSFAFYGINPPGLIVGSSNTTGDVATHAFLWDKGTMTDLGTLGGTFSTADGINPQGQVVGFSDTSTSTLFRAVLWDNGAITDLGTLGGPSGQATSINPQGQIVGFSVTTGGETHATLWTVK